MHGSRGDNKGSRPAPSPPKKSQNIGCLSNTEALPGGYLFPCSPEINWLVPLFPKNRKFVFLCSLFPNIVFVPLFASKFPEINALFPLFPQTPVRASILVWFPCEITKLSCQHSMLGLHRKTPAKLHLNGISLAGRQMMAQFWWYKWIISPLIN